VDGREVSRVRGSRALLIASAAVILGCALLTPAIGRSAGAAGSIAYPDLISVIPASDLAITHPTPTTKEFDYSHVVFNAGAGPLEVQPTNYDPSTNLATGVQDLYSYDSSGNATLAQTHTARDQFFYHTVHQHYHFPLATFGLYSVNNDGSLGTPVAVSPKNGFCLGDDVNLDPTLPNSPTSKGYNGQTCIDPTATRGISVGWGDHYDKADPGQGIDITGVPDGTYWFHSVVDPDGNFLESDKTNNTTDIKVRISGDSVTPVSPLMSQGAFVFDQSFLVDGTSTASTPAFNTSAPNELLVAFVAADGGTGAQTATLTGGGLTWTLARRTNTQTGTAEVWTAMATSPLTNAVVKSTLSGGFGESLSVFAIRGASGIGATGSGSGSAGSPGASLTTTTPGSWVMAVGDDPDHALPAVPTSGQTTVHQYVDLTGRDSLWMEAMPAPTAAAGTPVSFTHSYPGGDQWNATAVELLPATSSDHTPPVISGVSVSSLGSNHATVSWNTDEPSSSRVDYGLTPSFGQSTTPDPILVTQHSEQVTGLTPSTTYSFQVASTDSAGNTATNGPSTFTTTPQGTNPAVLSNIRQADLEPDQAIIAWNSDESTDSQVDYGVTSSYGSSSTLDPSMTTSHFVLITNLQPSTLYHYRVEGTDEFGNFGSSTDLTFETPAIPPLISVDRTTSLDGTGSLHTAPFSTAGAAETLVAFVSADGSGSTAQTATVTGGGLTWTMDTRADTMPGDAEVWHAFAPAKVSNAVITSTLASGSFDQSLTVIAFKGAVDVGSVASASAPTGAPTASLSTTGPSAVIYGAGSDATSATAHAPVGGQSLVHQDLDTAAANTFWVQQLDGDSGAVDNSITIADTAPTTDAFNLSVVEIRRPISVPPPAPIAPKISTIALGALGATSATITWTTNVAATSQVIYGTTTSFGQSSTIDLVGKTTHAITLTGLAPHTRYRYEIVSANGVGQAPAGARTLRTGGPSAPEILVETAGSGQVTLKWKPAVASDGAITDYIVTPYVAGFAQPEIDFSSSLTTEAVTGLANGTAYTFTVVGVNAVGTGLISPPSASIVPGTPTAPRSQRATAGAASASVQWKAPLSDNGAMITGYVVTPFADGVAEPSQTFASAATAEVVIDLTAGTSYRFTVAAINQYGAGAASRLTPAVTPT